MTIVETSSKFYDRKKYWHKIFTVDHKDPITLWPPTKLELPFRFSFSLATLLLHLHFPELYIYIYVKKFSRFLYSNTVVRIECSFAKTFTNEEAWKAPPRTKSSFQGIVLKRVLIDHTKCRTLFAKEKKQGKNDPNFLIIFSMLNFVEKKKAFFSTTYFFVLSLFTKKQENFPQQKQALDMWWKMLHLLARKKWVSRPKKTNRQIYSLETSGTVTSWKSSLSFALAAVEKNGKCFKCRTIIKLYLISFTLCMQTDRPTGQCQKHKGSSPGSYKFDTFLCLKFAMEVRFGENKS